MRNSQAGRCRAARSGRLGLRQRPAGPVQNWPTEKLANAGEKNSVEGCRHHLRSDWRAQACDLVQIGEIGADQRPHAAGNISKRRRIVPREQQ